MVNQMDRMKIEKYVYIIETVHRDLLVIYAIDVYKLQFGFGVINFVKYVDDLISIAACTICMIMASHGHSYIIPWMFQIVLQDVFIV